jgi:iron complex transport system substrate-binding protein
VKRVIGQAAALLAIALSAGPACAAPPKRIVSMNVCVDQYLILLADPQQIGALSRFSRDPTMSFYASRAARYPVSRSSVEEVLALKPDMVFASPYRSKAAFRPLERRGVPILEIGAADTFDQMLAQARQIAAAVGHPERGEALVAQMRARLAVVEARPKAKGVAAYYQRRGFVTGEGTLVDDIMRRAGFENLARRMKLGPLAQVSLEAMLRAHPDYLILESNLPPDNGAAMLAHPALARIVPPARRLFIPAAMTVCGGPFFPDAIALLQDQAARAPVR